MITAAAKPNSISWVCHSTGANFNGSVTRPRYEITHNGIPRQASVAAPR